MIFTHCVKIYIPNRDRLGDTIDNRLVCARLEQILVDRFGGVRRHVEQSAWKSASGAVMNEETTVLTSSFGTRSLSLLVDVVGTAVMELSSMLDQEAIGLEVDGEFVCISRPAHCDDSGIAAHPTGT